MPSFTGSLGQGRNKTQSGPPSDGMSERIQNIKLPEKVRCARCKKFKGHHAYSNKQLSTARFIRYNNKTASVDDRINCIPCTGGQVVELKCCHCKNVKGLEEFSKVQRRAGDEAKCEKCVEKQLSCEFNERVEEGSDEDENYDRNDPYYNDNPNYPGPPPGTLSTTSGDSEDARSAAMGSRPTRSDWSQQDRPKNEEDKLLLEKFNPQGYGHPANQSGGPSSADPPSSERSAPSIATNKGSKWAKVKAYKPQPERTTLDSSSEDEGVYSDDDDD